MLNNIHQNIHYKFNVLKNKIKLIKIVAELEEEEEEKEAGCCRNLTTKKKQHMDHHPSLI
jgi:hypothetical protein